MFKQGLTWVPQVQSFVFASDQLPVNALARVDEDALTALHKVDDVPRVRQHVLAVPHAVHRDVGGEGVPDVLVQVGLHLALLKRHTVSFPFRFSAVLPMLQSVTSLIYGWR